MNKVIVVCGPTASGKTRFAHLLAKRRDGEIINADSRQLYKQLPIITASPSLDLKNELPYYLYNFLDIDSEYSVAKYAKEAAKIIKEISARGKIPLLVGGSGMYINALINGLSDIPDIDIEIRKKVRNLQKELSSEDFFNLLAKSDIEAASILKVNDSQRVARAYEVYLQSGNSICFYQKNNIVRFLEGFVFEIILLLPNRVFLYSMCESRLENMFQAGAIEEVREIINSKRQDLTPAPAMKSLGVLEITSYLNGDISKDEALSRSKTKTRQYAKRQVTWFKNQIRQKNTLKFSSYEEYEGIIRMVSPPGLEPGTP